MNFVFARVLFVLMVVIGLWPMASLALGDPAYTADVPVNSQSDDDRVAGLRMALGQVLAGLSGDAAAASRVDVAKALAQASNYVQQYQYVRIADTSGNPSSHLLLRAQFDSAAVDNLMRRLHLGTQAGEVSNVVADQGGSVRVWIGGIHSANDYSRAMAALIGSESVLAAMPERAQSDGMLVVVKLRNGVQRLLENLAAAQTLSPLAEAKTVDGVDLQLAFRP